MPTYGYACRDCGHTFDIVQSMWDEPLTMCPECGGSLRKVFAPPAISFKGSGFYATDHRKKAKASTDERSGDTGDKAVGAKGAGATTEAPGKEASSGSTESTGTSSKKEQTAS